MYKLFILIVLATCIFPLLKAQPSGDCDCFDTRIIHAADTMVNCRYYEFEITNNGNCRHGLSNFTMAIECGAVSDTWSSLNTQIEENFTDPNNGLWGYKVDNIQGFGEDAIPDSFQVGFIFCADDDYCLDMQSYWEPVVAYKAGGCIIYDTLDISFLPGLTPKVVVAPNPSAGPMSFSFTMPGEGAVTLEILDVMGNRRSFPLQSSVNRQQRLHRTIDVSSMNPGMYFYLVRTKYGNASGRIQIQ